MQNEQRNVHDISPDLQRKIDAFIEGKQREACSSQFKVKRRLGVYLIVFLSFFSTIILIEPQRIVAFGERSVKLIAQAFEGYSEGRIEGAKDVGEDFVFEQYLPSYVPKGFEMESNDVFPIGSGTKWKDAAGREILLRQMMASGTGMLFDTEDVEEELLAYMDREIHIYTKRQRDDVRLMWYDEIYLFWMTSDVSSRSKSELIKMAKSIIDKQIGTVPKP